MKELKERVAGETPKGVTSDWTKDGTSKEVIVKEFSDGSAVLSRLRGIIDSKFQEQAAKEYDANASDRTATFSAGYRKALKDIYRLIQLDI